MERAFIKTARSRPRGGNENFAVGLTLLTERENMAKETWRRVAGEGVGEGVTTRKGSGTRTGEGERVNSKPEILCVRALRL